jgi:hypothetical protein
MRARAARLGAVAALGCIPCLGAEYPDTRTARELRSLDAAPVPALAADEAYIQAARKEGLTVPAGRVLQRRKLLARVFPHLLFPESEVERMALSEEFIFSGCPERLEEGRAAAWGRYRALAAKIPDSLLPPWDSMAPSLAAAKMRAMPACRSKLLVRSSPESFREECSDMPREDEADAEASAGESRFWSPACLQIGSFPPAACLVLARDGARCQVTVGEFNAGSAEYRLLAQGTLAEGRADLLRAILRQEFSQGGARAPDRNLDPGQAENPVLDWKTPVRFQAASDTALLEAGGNRWLHAYLEDLPEELYPLRDSAASFAAPVRRATRYGYFLIEFDPRATRPSRPGRALLEDVEALARALGRERGILEKNAKSFYSSWDALYHRPDTLSYSLWLSPSPSPDTARCRPTRVLSIRVRNAIDSLAWKYALGKRPDSLLGPFPTPYGTILLQLRGKSQGEGKIPFGTAKEAIRADMARGLVLGSALGLLRDGIEADADFPATSTRGDPPPRFQDKEELIQAVGRLQYGPGGAGKSVMQELARTPRPVLEAMFRIRKQEEDQEAWLKGLTIAPEAERFGLRL